MRRALMLTRSLIGQKIIMAASGVILVLFLVGHMLGNLKIFAGPAKFNGYAEGLRELGAPFFGHGQVLWLVRLALLGALLAHIAAAVAVTRASWRARPTGYRRLDLIETTYAARTMRWGGVIIALYVVYHLLDFTFGAVNPGFEPGNVYRNVVASFQLWPVTLVYFAANGMVGLHLYHGVWSAAQTLGVTRTPADRWRRGVAGTMAAAITLGYVAVPVAVLTGVVR